MKFSIEWHEECLENSMRSLAVKQQQFARLHNEIEKHKSELEFKASQICAAKTRGLTAFDPDRLLRKRAKP